ncbi:MAG: TrmH family RNA methyltransferase [Mycobacteriales bacterium]
MPHGGGAMTMTGRPGAGPFTERTPRVAAARKLTRRRERDTRRSFLAEGAQAVREALAYGEVGAVFATEAAAGRHPDLVAAAEAAGVPVHPVTDRAAAGLSETVTPQGLVAVCAYLDVPAVPPAARLVAVLAEIRDPGNAGTVLRCADAAGADAVVFTAGSVDPYHGRVVRASAGSLFHLPVLRDADPAATVDTLRAAGCTVLATDGHGETDLYALEAAGPAGPLAGPVAWVFGNEARGLPSDLAGHADHRVRIPIHGKSESLNLGAAAAICLYASARALHTSIRREAGP